MPNLCISGGRIFILGAVLPVLAASPSALYSQTVGGHAEQSVVSDWTHRHLLTPYTSDLAAMRRTQADPRYIQNWYGRHTEAWWPGLQKSRAAAASATTNASSRDWSTSLGTGVAFEPLFDFTYSIGGQVGYGSVNSLDELNNTYLATAGSMTVTGTYDVGTYSLEAGGPANTDSSNGAFIYNNLLYTGTTPYLDGEGLLFANSSDYEINLWGNSSTQYAYYDSAGSASGYPHSLTGSPFALTTDPGAGQIFPAKYVFDVTATPSCTNDYVALGLAVPPASGGQANIVGYNNLYTGTSPAGLCTGSGPTVKFAYASGTGEVPGNVVLSQDGKVMAYVENLLTGSSYFHVLILGTTGSNGSSVTGAVVPGVGNNAQDTRVLLSPDGGTTNQSSTTSPYVSYITDTAYVTTYSASGTGSGYVYKFKNVLAGNGVPVMVWSVAVNAIPSSPVYDYTSNNVFFTDSSGRIDYITDTGTSPTVTYGTALAAAATSENPVVVDSTNQKVYATFNTNGTNALVVQTSTTLTGTVSAAVGTGTTKYTGPYGIDFNNAFYSGTGTPLLYVAGYNLLGVPTLYDIGFTSGKLHTAITSSAALASGSADASPVTEFYNSTLAEDFLFVGVTNHCIATTGGGTAGCVMSLNITNGFPTVNAATTALAATGGTSGIAVDNSSSASQASSIYYGTKTAGTLVKATQSGLN